MVITFKAALVHDIIASHNLDLLVLTETWFNSSLPRAVTDDVAPVGYAVAHTYRQSGHGGGVSVIYRNPGVRADVVEMKSSAGTTDRLVLKLITQRGRVNLAAVYRPPSSSPYGVSVGQFCGKFVDFLDELLLLPGLPVICGDFNCPGADSVCLDYQLSDVLESRNLVQSVTQSTHRAGNLLDLLITLEDTALIDGIEVHDPGCSDHMLVTADVAVGRVKTCSRHITYRNMKIVDPAIFAASLRKQAVCTAPENDVNSYADQLERDITAVLDQLAPCQTKTKRFGRRPGQRLSKDAVEAKRLRRKLELQWKQSGSETDRVAYRKACRSANTLIVNSRRPTETGGCCW